MQREWESKGCLVAIVYFKMLVNILFTEKIQEQVWMVDQQYLQIICIDLTTKCQMVAETLIKVVTIYQGTHSMEVEMM